jgi:hypothetical protein
MRSRWLEALSRQTDPERKATLLEYLQEPPSRFAPTTIERQSDKVTRLLKLAVDRHPTRALTPALLQHYSQGMRRRPPSRFQQLQEPRRTLELVSFVQYALFEHTDTLIKLIDRRVARLWANAAEQARRTRERGSDVAAANPARRRWLSSGPTR